jgi:hypothetical protein
MATIRHPPKNRSELRPVDKAFIHSVMFEMGILPIEDPILDMRVPLRTLSREEARVIKRKFRKLWRKFMKLKVIRKKHGDDTAPAQQKVLGDSTQRRALRRFGVGKHVPSRAERLERKRLVYEHLWNTIIVPMLQRFENPERGDNKEQKDKKA